METKKSNRLPEGVGKKIVEALKKQSELINDIKEEEEIESSPGKIHQNTTFDEGFDNIKSFKTSLPENDSIRISIENGFSSEKFDDSPDLTSKSTIDREEYQGSQKDSEYESVFGFDVGKDLDYESDFDILDYDEDFEEPKPVQSLNQQYSQVIEQQKPVPQEAEVPTLTTVRRSQLQQIHTAPGLAKLQNAAKQETPLLNSDFSSSVDVLTRLVSQLPSGVTRQTGAQIIRQTMEAMGLSMNKILGEAQQAHEEIRQHVRDSINTIEEYRNNIKILEKEVQNCRKQADELEDIINLFILSDKNAK